MGDNIIASSKKSLYQKREKIYTRVIKGRSQIQRLIVAFIVYGCFFTLPWIQWGENPAIYFDLTARKFHIFSLTFWPQDFIYLAWVLIIAAFALFLFTTVAGRLWCGFACPQTIWTLAYIWVEEKIEGKPHIRKRLDKAPWSAEKIAKKTAKHFIWIIMAIVTAMAFVSYFYPARELWPDLFSANISLTALLWVGIFTWLTYIDAAWLREQVCIYMCPYARFQGVMYDQDTLMVTYNAAKGEPRGSVKDADKGQCIDCHVCVQVCPTGIDIRDGAQVACINCALCVDACNDVMLSVGRPQDLITFSTLNSIENQKASPIIRPRTVGYAAVMLVMVGLLLSQLWQRVPLEVSVIRDRDHIYRHIDNKAANDYWLNIANKSPNTQQFFISVEQTGYRLQQQPDIELAAGEAGEYQIVIISEQKGQGANELTLRIRNQDGSMNETTVTRFIYPPAR